MSRLVALLFALLLPLQFAWGAAAAYCQHEATAEHGRHFGHHEHLHQAESPKKPAPAKLVPDNDCSACHATCASVATGSVPRMEVPVSVAGMNAAADAAPTSAPPRAPDRPQWLRLA